MKRLLLILSAILFGCLTANAQISSHVDERFELTSISFRLAGIPEYSQCSIPAYAEAIDTYFKPYADSELTDYILELRENYGVAYDALPSVTALLEIKNGRVRLQPRYDISKISEVDSRWNKETLAKYLKLLDKFYRESDFRRFFDEHKEQYALTEKQLDACISEIKTEWFETFFGEPLDPHIGVYVCLTNGPHNYAFDQGILIGASEAYHIDTVYTVLHELCHHYTGPLFFAHLSEVEEAANKIFSVVWEEMRQRAYGTAKTTLLEWLNNLCVLMYYKEYLDRYGYVRVWTRINANNGFIWMPRSVEFMENFYEDRTSYPHIDDFMPQLALFLNYTANNMDVVQQEFERRHPYVTGVFPAVGSDISNEKEIRVRFSEPMRTDCKGVWLIDETIEIVPNDYDSSYWKDDRTFVIPILTDSLAPNRIYGIKVSKTFFLSDKDYILDRDTDLIFNTTKK